MNDVDIIALRSAGGATARMHAHGAHVLSWQPAGAGECLYLSPLSEFGSSAAIRGGIPIIFPQFANEGPLPKHGFARNRRWQQCKINEAACTYELSSDATTRAIWPRDFTARVEVLLADASLSVSLSVTNTGTEAFDFTAALHTYLAVEDIGKTTLRGLQGIQYRDSTRDGMLVNETSPITTVNGEVDRIYLSAPSSITMRSSTHSVRVDSSAFPDTVVWNPGQERCAALKDMPADGYLRMLCVEAAVIGMAVALHPGESWWGSQVLHYLR